MCVLFISVYAPCHTDVYFQKDGRAKIKFVTKCANFDFRSYTLLIMPYFVCNYNVVHNNGKAQCAKDIQQLSIRVRFIHRAP